MTLHEEIAARLSTQRERYRKLAKEHGDVVVADVTVGQIVGGMRGIKSLLTDISFVDPGEGHDDYLMSLALVVQAAKSYTPRKAIGQ